MWIIKTPTFSQPISSQVVFSQWNRIVVSERKYASILILPFSDAAEPDIWDPKCPARDSWSVVFLANHTVYLSVPRFDERVVWDFAEITVLLQCIDLFPSLDGRQIQNQLVYVWFFKYVPIIPYLASLRLKPKLNWAFVGLYLLFFLHRPVFNSDRFTSIVLVGNTAIILVSIPDKLETVSFASPRWLLLSIRRRLACHKA